MPLDIDQIVGWTQPASPEQRVYAARAVARYALTRTDRATVARELLDALGLTDDVRGRT